jgi:hypothetical protein
MLTTIHMQRLRFTCPISLSASTYGELVNILKEAFAAARRVASGVATQTGRRRALHGGVFNTGKQNFLALALLPCFGGCMVAPIQSELPLLGTNLEQRSTQTGEVVMILFNNSSKLMYGLDSTGRINVRLNGKAVGGPNIGEYVILQIPKGKHRLLLSHLDLIEFKSEYDIEAADDPLIVEMAATPISNSIQVHKKLPDANYLPQPFTPYQATAK